MRSRSKEMTDEHRTRLDTWIDEGATAVEIGDRLRGLGYAWDRAVIHREIAKRRDKPDKPPKPSPARSPDPVRGALVELQGAVLDPSRLQDVAASDLDFVRRRLSDIASAGETEGARIKAAVELADLARDILDLAKVATERAK